MDEILAALSVSLTGDWPAALRANLEDALFAHIGEKDIRLWLNNKPVTLHFGGSKNLAVGTYFGLTSKNRVTFFANQNTNPVINVLHEFGHLVDNLWEDFFTKNLEKIEFRKGEKFFAGWNGQKYLGLRSDVIRKEVLKQSRVAGGDAWQQRGGVAHWEDWADIFSNAMLQNIDPENEVGQQILDFVASMDVIVKGPDATGE